MEMSGTGRQAPDLTVKDRQMLLPFELPEVEGGQINVWRYRGKQNLVLFFAHSRECSRCREMIKELCDKYTDIKADETEILVVLPMSCNDALTLKKEIGAECPVLCDEKREVFNRYGLLDDRGQVSAAMLIADRFGEVYKAFFADEAHGFPSVNDLTSWLRFIEIQCPECGAPMDWPR